MITNCPFCNETLISEQVKTVKGGNCTQLNCPVHGFIEIDVQQLAKKFEALKCIFARYVADSSKENFTDGEWEAIESLNNED